MAERAVLPSQAVAHAETMVRTASDEASRMLTAQFTDTAAAYGTVLLPPVGAWTPRVL